MTLSVRTAAASCLLLLWAATSSLADVPWHRTPYLSGCESADSLLWPSSPHIASRGSVDDLPPWVAYPCSRWTATADVLFLQRSAGGAQNILFRPAMAQADVVALNVADLGFDWEFGPRATLNYWMADNWSLEIDFFEIEGWSASQVVDGNPLILFPPAVMVSNQFAVDYDSDLHSTELNLCRQFGDRLRLIAGLRWVELHERFSVIGVSPSPLLVPQYATQTGNSMYGLQIGVVEKFLDRGGRLHFNTFLKAGIYGNRAKQETASVGNVTPLVTAADRGSNTSFLGEVGLTALYRLGDHASLRTGYQMTWIEGVALAPDQVPFTNVTPNTAGSATLNARGQLIFHGLHVGLELVW